MPDRILRTGFLTSDGINSLSVDSERFYVRLILVADDFGRFDGRPAILLSYLFPLKSSEFNHGHIEDWISDCVKAGVLSRYEVEGKPYILIERSRQRIRPGTASKFPPPPATRGNQPQLAAERGGEKNDNPSKPLILHDSPELAAERGDSRRKSAQSVSESDALSYSSAGSESVPERPPATDAHIPSVAEVIAWGEVQGIPEFYCREYHAKKEIKNSWLNGYNRLIKWKLEILQWFSADNRPTKPKEKIESTRRPVDAVKDWKEMTPAERIKAAL